MEFALDCMLRMILYTLLDVQLGENLGAGDCAQFSRSAWPSCSTQPRGYGGQLLGCPNPAPPARHESCTFVPVPVGVCSSEVCLVSWKKFHMEQHGEIAIRSCPICARRKVDTHVGQWFVKDRPKQNLKTGT